MDWELERGFEESNSVINSLVSSVCVLGLGIVLLLDEDDGFLDPREKDTPFMVIDTQKEQVHTKRVSICVCICFIQSLFFLF